MNIIETSGLGKRYRGIWALLDCTLAIPPSRIVALVGPNGAGKTTLLHLIVGLITPTSGSVVVLGSAAAGSPSAHERIAFVAQDAPLYHSLSVANMLDLAGTLNLHFDRRLANTRLSELGVPLGRKVGKLSGGQQAQLALTIALARHPDLLVLDEPISRLDPVARHDFMGSLMMAAVEDGLSVVFSSHVVSELERVADYLVVLTGGHVQVMGDISDLLASHAMLIGPVATADPLAERLPVVQMSRAGRQAQLLARISEAGQLPSGWEIEDVSLEELVLAYMRDPSAYALPGPRMGINSRKVGAT